MVVMNSPTRFRTAQTTYKGQGVNCIVNRYGVLAKELHLLYNVCGGGPPNSLDASMLSKEARLRSDVSRNPWTTRFKCRSSEPIRNLLWYPRIACFSLNTSRGRTSTRYSAWQHVVPQAPNFTLLRDHSGALAKLWLHALRSRGKLELWVPSVAAIIVRTAAHYSCLIELLCVKIILDKEQSDFKPNRQSNHCRIRNVYFEAFSVRGVNRACCAKRMSLCNTYHLIPQIQTFYCHACLWPLLIISQKKILLRKCVAAIA